MPEDKNNLIDQYYEVRILFKKSDQLKWATYYNEIEELIRIGKSVPTSLIKKWFSYFNNYETIIKTLQKQKADKEINELSKIAFAHFKNNEDYNFTGKKSVEIFQYQRPTRDGIKPEPRSSHKELVHYSLEGLIYYCLSSYLQQEKKPAKKRDAILFFFKCIETYSEQFNKQHLKQLNPYKKKVIAGVLTHTVGITMVHEPMKFTNENIHQQTRYAFLEKSYKKNVLKKKKP
jgi:hypothetical protein